VDEVTFALIRMFAQIMAVPVLWLLGWDLFKVLSR